MALNLIMLGPPGAGKGTQAEALARQHGIPRISTGDILREAVQAGTEVGRLARATMDAGRLVGDDVMIAIVSERLNRPDTDAGFVLDGFPRTVPQAEALDALVADRAPLVVVDIVVPTEELVRRLQGRRVCGRCGANASVQDGPEARCGRCGGSLVPRSDDADGVVRERLRVYEERSRPLVAYYRDRPTFRTVDGNQRPPAVSAAIQAAVTSAGKAAEAERRP